MMDISKSKLHFRYNLLKGVFYCDQFKKSIVSLHFSIVNDVLNKIEKCVLYGRGIAN